MNLPFEEDPRFKACAKDMLITYAFLISNLVATLAVCFGLGGKKSMTESVFIFGMPDWLALALGVFVVFYVLLIFLCKKVFADISVDAYTTGEEEK